MSEMLTLDVHTTPTHILGGHPYNLYISKNYVTSKILWLLNYVTQLCTFTPRFESVSK